MRITRNIIVALLATCCMRAGNSKQDDPRIQLFFQRSFFLLHEEVSGKKLIQHPGMPKYELDSLGPDAYIIKGIPGIHFYMQRITYIKMEMGNKGQYTEAPLINKKIIKKWEDWYNKNKNNLVWDEETKSPEIKKK